MTSIQFGIYQPEEEEVEVEVEAKEEINSDGAIFIIPSEIDPRYPEMYDAETGEQLVIALIEIELISADSGQADAGNNYITGLIKEIGDEIAKETVDSVNEQLNKTIQQYALLQLEKGNIATIDPKITHGPTTVSGAPRRISKKVFYTNDGQKVMLRMPNDVIYTQGGNVVTTKGVDQISHFSKKHWSKVTGLKGILQNAIFIGSVIELTDMTMAEHNGKRPSLPIPIPFANFLSKMMLEQAFGDLERAVDEDLTRDFNKLKSKGLRVVEIAIRKKSSFMKQRGYGIVRVRGETLADILSGKENNMEDVLNRYEPNPVATLLYRTVEDPKSAGYFYLIETIFIH